MKERSINFSGSVMGLLAVMVLYCFCFCSCSAEKTMTRKEVIDAAKECQDGGLDSYIVREGFGFEPVSVICRKKGEAY